MISMTRKKILAFIGVLLICIGFVFAVLFGKTCYQVKEELSYRIVYSLRLVVMDNSFSEFEVPSRTSQRAIYEAHQAVDIYESTWYNQEVGTLEKILATLDYAINQVDETGEIKPQALNAYSKLIPILKAAGFESDMSASTNQEQLANGIQAMGSQYSMDEITRALLEAQEMLNQ